MANINNNFKALSLSTESEVLVSSKFHACSIGGNFKKFGLLIFSLLLFSTGLTRTSLAYQYSDWSSYASWSSYGTCSEYASISSKIASWSPDTIRQLCQDAYSVTSSAVGASIHNNLTSYVPSSTSYDNFFRVAYCKNVTSYTWAASYYDEGGYCGASWIKTAMATSASSSDWYSAAEYASKLNSWNNNYYRQQLGSQTASVLAYLCSSGSYVGISGSYVDESGNTKYSGAWNHGLCNGCPKSYLKGEDGRCHPAPPDCRIAAIDGNTTFCSSYGCVSGSNTSDGFGGCASAGASLSSYSQNPSNTHCDVNIDYNYSYSAPFYGKGAAYSTYIDENGSTVEGIICGDSGCPKGYAKTEDGRCKTLKNTEGCDYVWAKGYRVYCGHCESGYGKTPFGECKPCNPGCKNGCSQNDYTSCSGGCKAGYTGNGCETCTNGKFYQDGECVSSCAEGYYQAGTKCVKNPDGCASYNYSTGSCSDCSGGSYLDGVDCKANPKGCDSYNGTSCDVCSDGYYSASGICKANPTGCTDYSGTYCYSCSSGYLEKDGACIPASNGCGAGYKDMGGFCNRVQWTPAEAAAVLTDDNNNSVTITFKK